MRTLVALSAPTLGEENRLLQLVHPVPAALSENAEAVQAGFRDYQELSLSRIGLKRIFRVTLTVTVLLTVSQPARALMRRPVLGTAQNDPSTALSGTSSVKTSPDLSEVASPDLWKRQ